VTRLPSGPRPSPARLIATVVAAVLCWYVVRHVPYQIIKFFSTTWNAAPKHWIAGHSERPFTIFEIVVATSCAALTARVTFNWRPPARPKVSAARWLYNRTNGAITNLLIGVIPIVLIFFSVKFLLQSLGHFAHVPNSQIAQANAPILAMSSEITYLAASCWIALISFSTFMKWITDRVAANEGLSPTLLAILVADTLPGCITGPLLVLFWAIGFPFVVPWLAWRLLMTLSVLLGLRWILGRYLASNQATVHTLPTLASFDRG